MAVLAVVGMMVFPLPPSILNLLLVCNISFALALLVSSIYLSEPQKFTSLPTILLLATLFRLGLNISTTRQILGSGSAPDIIVTFGNFVVRGNLVVGAVLFIIITLVQFMVIAKGAERVAEVAARFTLDAMPGKQMSIDADVRSGAIGLDEAKQRRRELQRESRLYGALDGAMKFVKGDTIAGLVITIVNITAGLVVGVSQQGLSFIEAAQKYSLYTIGDGLVSQIPALLVAVAAGIAVTRVGDSESKLIGRDIVDQLSEEPQGLLTTALVLAALSFVPGMSFFGFMTLAAGFACAARTVKNQGHLSSDQSVDGGFAPKLHSSISLRISVDGTIALQQEKILPEMITSMRDQYFDKWGLVLPDISFDVDQRRQGVCASILLHGVEIEVFEHRETQENINFSTQVASMLNSFIERYRVDMLSDTHVRMLLEVHHSVAEDLINNVVPELVSITELTQLLRGLLKERVSIKNMSVILQSIADVSSLGVNQNAVSQSKLLVVVRTALRRTISREFADSSWRLRAGIVASELDAQLVSDEGQGVALHPKLVETIATQVRQFCERYNTRVVLTSPLARMALVRILEQEGVDAAVLSVEEVSEEVVLDVVSEIDLVDVSLETAGQAVSGTKQEKVESGAEDLRLLQGAMG
jgi:flagellar biosynthesis component FlhA